MKSSESDFLAELERIAVAAQREEIAFRENIAAEITRRERARQFAFRRLDLARTMAAAAIGADSEDDAVARQVAALMRELDWASETEQRAPVLAAWRPVAEAVWRNLPRDAEGAENSEPAPGERPDVQQAMLAFERWYESDKGQPFLALLDQVIEEMPVVEF